MAQILNTYYVSDVEFSNTNDLIEYIYAHIDQQGLHMNDDLFRLDMTCKYLLNTSSDTMKYSDIRKRIHRMAIIDTNAEFYTPFHISEKLANLLNVPSDICMSPYTVTIKLYQYFKENDLLLTIDEHILFKPNAEICQLSKLFVEDTFEPFYKLKYYIAPLFQIK